MAIAPVTPDDFVPGRWRGRWTWLAKEDADVPDGLFRRSFELAEVPVRVPARLTADTRYRLFVNGIEASAGPIRSQPHRWRYDLVDLAPYLRSGRNVLALQVKHLRGGGAYWMPAPRNETLGGHGVFVFEAGLDDAEWLISDHEWRGYACPAWSDLVGGGLPVEVLDAKRLPNAVDRAGLRRQWVEARRHDPAETCRCLRPRPVRQQIPTGLSCRIPYPAYKASGSLLSGPTSPRAWARSTRPNLRRFAGWRRQPAGLSPDRWSRRVARLPTGTLCCASTSAAS